MGPNVNLTEPKKNRTGLRLGLMVLLLVFAVSATLMAQAQSTDPPGEGPAAAVPAQPTAPAADVAAGTQPVDISDNPFYKVRDLYVLAGDQWHHRRAVCVGSDLLSVFHALN